MKTEIKAETKCLAVLPMVKHYISEMGIYDIFNKHMPKRPNAFMVPAHIVCMMIINIICAARPCMQG